MKPRTGLIILLIIAIAGCMSNPKIYLSGESTINGTATGDDFDSYSLEYAKENENFSQDGEWQNESVIIPNADTEKTGEPLGTFKGSNVWDGDYRLRLTADAHNQSAMDYFHLTVDNVYISSPDNLSLIPKDDYLVIRGGVLGDDLDHFEVVYRKEGEGEWQDDGVRLPDDGEKQVKDDKLAVIDTSEHMNENAAYEVMLKAHFEGGHNETEKRTLIYVEEDQYEQDDSEDNTSSIQINETQERTVYPAYDEDYISVPVQMRTKYMATVKHPSFFYITVRLYDGGFTPIYDTTVIVEDDETRLIWENDFYTANYLNIHSFDGDIGPYSVTVERFMDSDDDGSPDHLDCKPEDPTVLAPYDGVSLTGNTTLCSGDYSLSVPMSIEEDAHITCNDTTFKNEDEHASTGVISIEGGSDITIEGCTLKGIEPAFVASKYGMALKNTTFTLRNNLLDFNESSPSKRSTPFEVDTAHLRIINNTIIDYGTGIPESSAYEALYANNTIASCKRGIIGESREEDDLSITGNQIRESNIGINIEGSGTIRENRLSGCPVGINVEGGHALHVGNNRINDSFEGISVMESKGVQVTKNSLMNNKVSVRTRANKGPVNITNNDITSSKKGAILKNSGVIFSHNSVLSNERGIELIDTMKNKLLDNNISENKIGLYLRSEHNDDKKAQDAIAGNLMFQNTEYDIVNNRTTNVTINDTLFDDNSREAIMEEVYDGRDEEGLGFIKLKELCTRDLDSIYALNDDFFLCPGTYTLEDDIEVKGNDILFDCKGANIDGDHTHALRAIRKEGFVLNNCNLDGIILNISNSEKVTITKTSFVSSHLDVTYLMDSNIAHNTFEESALWVEDSADIVMSSNVLEETPLGLGDSNHIRLDSNRLKGDSSVYDYGGYSNTIYNNSFNIENTSLGMKGTARIEVKENTFSGGEKAIRIEETAPTDALVVKTVSENRFKDVGLLFENKGALDVMAPENEYIGYEDDLNPYIIDKNDNATLGFVNISGRVINETPDNPACQDSDGGENYSVKGTVTMDGDTKTDYCVDDYDLKEFICVNDRTTGEIRHTCTNGCEDGACKQKNTTTPTCSDGVKNQNETGVDCGGPCPPCTNATLYTGTQTGGLGRNVTITVYANDTTNDTLTMGFDLTYDDEVLEYTGESSAGELIQHWKNFKTNTPTENTINLKASDPEEQIIPDTYGPIAHFTFTVTSCESSPLELSNLEVKDKDGDEVRWKSENGTFQCNSIQKTQTPQTTDEMNGFSDINDNVQEESIEGSGETNVRFFAGSDNQEEAVASQNQKEAETDVVTESENHNPIVFGLLLAMLIAVIFAVVIEVGAPSPQMQKEYQNSDYALVQNYLDENYRKGFSLQQLQASLVQQGWDKDAVKLVARNIREKDKNQPMTSEQVTQFVADSLNEGYDSKKIEGALIANGIAADVASQMVRSLKKRVPQKKR